MLTAAITAWSASHRPLSPSLCLPHLTCRSLSALPTYTSCASLCVFCVSLLSCPSLVLSLSCLVLSCLVLVLVLVLVLSIHCPPHCSLLVTLGSQRLVHPPPLPPQPRTESPPTTIPQTTRRSYSNNSDFNVSFNNSNLLPSTLFHTAFNH